MNKNKIFLLAAVTALTGGALVGAAAFTRGSSFNFAKASGGDPVAHTITFAAGDAKNVRFNDQYSYYTFDISKKTSAGNDFEASVVAMHCYSTDDITLGEQGDGFLFRFANPGYPYYLDSNHKSFALNFDMKLDAGVEPSGHLYRTVRYHVPDTDPSDDTKANEEIDLYDLGGGEYCLDYTFAFKNEYQEYITIKSITIEYSCTY